MRAIPRADDANALPPAPGVQLLEAQLRRGSARKTRMDMQISDEGHGVLIIRSSLISPALAGNLQQGPWNLTLDPGARASREHERSNHDATPAPVARPGARASREHERSNRDATRASVPRVARRYATPKTGAKSRRLTYARARETLARQIQLITWNISNEARRLGTGTLLLKFIEFLPASVACPPDLAAVVRHNNLFFWGFQTLSY